MIIFDLNNNTHPRCGLNTITGARNDVYLEKALEKSYNSNETKNFLRLIFIHKRTLYLQIRLNYIQNDTCHGIPYLSPWNLASLQFQIRMKVHHLCSTVWDTKYPNLRNRTLLNRWLSLMECRK